MRIIIKNILGRRCKAAVVKLTSIRDHKSARYQSSTDENGVAKFDKVKKGEYVVQIVYKKVIKEQIINSNNIITIKIPTIFGWKKKLNLVSDMILCSYCKYEYDDHLINRFQCSYCKYRHCPTHRLPEHHACTGDPKAPPSSYRVIYSRKGTRIISK